MTNEEFSNQFDLLVDSYRRLKKFDDKEEFDSIEFNEYEKSYFLTQAQESIVMDYYKGIDEGREAFEQSEDVRRNLSSLVTTATITDKVTGLTGLEKTSVFYSLPSDLLYITYEAVDISSTDTCRDGKRIIVIPVTQDEYYRVSKNPFMMVNTRAYRLDAGDKVELICLDTISSYLVRYVKKPDPIILIDLPDGLTINNSSTATECKLHSKLHQEILDLAVRLALNSKASSTK